MEDPWSTEEQVLERRRRSKWSILLRVTVTVVTVAAIAWFLPPYIYGWMHPDYSPPHPIKAVAISPDRPDFISDEFGFAVKFPGEPTRGEANFGDGDAALHTTTFQSGADEAGYRVSTANIGCTPGENDVELLLKDALESSVTSVTSTTNAVASAWEPKKVTVQNHPALETSYTFTQGKERLFVSIAVLMAGPRYFAVIATNPPDGGWDTFLSSFKVATDDGGVLPACAAIPTT